MLDDRQEATGFVYHIPYMSNMMYPEKLFDKLKSFAQTHSGNILHAPTMLFAVQCIFPSKEQRTVSLVVGVAEEQKMLNDNVDKLQVNDARSGSLPRSTLAFGSRNPTI